MDVLFFHFIAQQRRHVFGIEAGLVAVKELAHGAGDLLEISGPGLKSALLLPFTLAVVPTVDLLAGRIIVDPPEGLD